ncbi:hypothetical protein NMY22_g3569 [Coprinellus aureogranulatus]|nr:hypothetical protein NMY22_g3569 [Coprinellus aureogranulatus]
MPRGELPASQTDLPNYRMESGAYTNLSDRYHGEVTIPTHFHSWTSNEVNGRGQCMHPFIKGKALSEAGKLCPFLLSRSRLPFSTSLHIRVPFPDVTIHLGLKSWQTLTTSYPSFAQYSLVRSRHRGLEEQALTNVMSFIPGTVGVFSIIVLGISAHLVHISNGFTPDWAGLALATSILTLLSLPVLYIVSIKRRGAVAAFVIVELIVLWILWILWLATGADAASSNPGLNFCNVGVCSEIRALEAFSFLNWLLLMFYSLTVLVLSVSAHSRGHRGVWRSQVNEFDWNSHKGGVVGTHA